MATITITKQWANGAILLEADLDYIKSGIETFLNTTGINDDNIQNAGITASSKLVDASISTAKLASSSVTTAKIADANVTTAKILDANVTYAKCAADVTSTLIPPGVIWEFAGATLPSGWLWPDGSAVSRTTYAALFTAIGTTHGTGDGSTTFNLPDRRGRVAAGKDNLGGSTASRLTSGISGGITLGTTLGSTGGAESHVITTAQSPAHTHTGTTDNATQLRATSKAFAGSGAYDPICFSAGDSSDATHNHTFTTASTGGGTAHNNVQPTIIMNFIIKT